MFRAALDAGNLPRVRQLAAEMPAVTLADAARILALIRLYEPQSFDRAAVRWMARYTRERARSVDDPAQAVDALDCMREDPRATDALAQLVR